MNLIRSINSLCALILSLSGAVAQEVNIPGTSRHSFENGLTVVLMEYRKVPSVVVRLVVRGGSAVDPEHLPGVASMTTSLMREGTKERSSTGISEAIDAIGGSLSVGAGLDYCAATLEVLKKDLDSGLVLFADVVMNPSFPPEEIERERRQRLAWLDAVKEDPSSIASMVFSREIYGDHPYGRQSEGTKASLASMSREHLLSFYDGTFVPDGNVLVAVGDFDSDVMLEKLRAFIGPWNSTSSTLSTPGKTIPVTGRRAVLVDKPDATQTQIRMGNTGIDINHPDYFSLLVANTVFGSGFTSRLVEELRVKRSLTYGASSGFPASLAGGSFIISTFTKNETAAETIEVVLGEIPKFRLEGPRDEELAKAKNYIAGSFARDLQAPEALAAGLTDIELYRFPGDYLQKYIERIRGVGLEEVRSAIRDHFKIDDLVLVLVTSASSVAPRIEGFGPVQTVKLDDAVR